VRTEKQNVMNFDNFFITQNTDLNAIKSTTGSKLTKHRPRLTSMGSSRNGFSDSEKGRLGSPATNFDPTPTDQFLKVPNYGFDSSLAPRMDYILKKRSRLLERQKTKEKVNYTFGQEKDAPMPYVHSPNFIVE
jgi:hypothetical protein